MIYKLIAVVSKDGFIARYSGDLPLNWTSKEEQITFKKDIKVCEWSVMGRNTHELTYNENKKRIIFSSSVNDYKFINRNHIFFNPNGISFNKIINLIKPVSTICILGGTRVHDYFLSEKLINELIITVEPINFGNGLPLFSKIDWGNFSNILFQRGLRLKKEIKEINKKKTLYYHFSKN